MNEENTEMAIVPTTGSQPSQPTTGRKKRDGLPYLDNFMLSTVKKPATILDIRKTDEPAPGQRKYSDYTLKIEIDGKQVLTGVFGNLEKDQIFRTLYQAFGEDEKDWIGNTIELYLEIREFDQRTFRRASIPSNGQPRQQIKGRR
jgi:hypothetical protein